MNQAATQDMSQSLNLEERILFRRHQFNERVNARAEQEVAERAAIEQSRLDVKAAQKKRQATNRAAHAAASQAIRTARNGRNSKS